MSVCPACNSDVPGQGRFCGECGSSLEVSESLPTQTSAPEMTPRSAGPSRTTPSRGQAHHSRLSTSDDPVECRFLPGAMLEDRYRIVGLIGKGGMGEVYRADDLKLDQPVALKFLPETLEQREGRLDRFLGEVRVARQVSHPNVCRVYDVGVFDSQHYLSMEYVDGEDLASLLRRIGHLPGDKAVEIARQICAGLAAAHARGIVHRDLKPANVMIDGRGHVRITDFGLAGLAEGFQGAEIRAGTPDYMAPEQLSGKEVTVRSDVYALGLVLYELFTGKRAYRAESVAELRRLRESTPPPSPATLVDGLDPAAERVILRCLETDPEQRPASALAVAAALPGADPLAAALAAGETPSPEMVAEAGEGGGLRPWVATLLLASTLACVAVTFVLVVQLRLTERLPQVKPPAALVVESRQLLQNVGADAEIADEAFGYAVDRNYLNHVDATDPSPGRWDGLADVRPAPLHFWYRGSPGSLVPFGLDGSVTSSNPPLTRDGMSRVWLDAEGRLINLLVVPPTLSGDVAATVEPDWTPLFEAARLDPADFSPVEPRWSPRVDCDLREAWEGAYPDQPGVTVRAEAGAFRGRPVYFRVVLPWTERAQANHDGNSVGVRVRNLVLISVLLAILAGAIFLVRRNLNKGRGDRRSALRVAAYLFSVALIAWIIGAHHVASIAEVAQLFEAVSSGLLVAGVAWLVYLALEPYARRLWPHVLISWTRLLSGRLRDPLVGRDILVGLFAGAAVAIVALMGAHLKIWLGRAPDPPLAQGLESLAGFRFSLVWFFNLQLGATFLPIALLFLIVLLRMVLKNRWVAVGGTWLIMTAVGAMADTADPLAWLTSALVYAMVMATLLRAGLLATILTFVFADLLLHLPLTLDMGRWYAPWGLIVLALPLLVALYGYVVSLAGRPILTDVLADD